MHTIELVTIDGKSIHRGDHYSLNDAIESAIKKNIPLDGIDLSYKKLHHINLDGVKFHNASFEGADLTGANMSESDFVHCNFAHANLKDACLCYSNFTHCNFRLCKFNDTDISMACLEKCGFEGFSIFDMRLHSAFKLDQLTYHHFKEQYSFDAPPMLIKTPKNTTALLDNTMVIKGIPHTFEYATIDRTALKSLPETIQSIVDLKNKSR